MVNNKIELGYDPNKKYNNDAKYYDPILTPYYEENNILVWSILSELLKKIKSKRKHRINKKINRLKEYDSLKYILSVLCSILIDFSSRINIPYKLINLNFFPNFSLETYLDNDNVKQTVDGLIDKIWLCINEIINGLNNMEKILQQI
jgi:hypothetical protein